VIVERALGYHCQTVRRPVRTTVRGTDSSGRGALIGASAYLPAPDRQCRNVLRGGDGTETAV